MNWACFVLVAVGLVGCREPKPAQQVAFEPTAFPKGKTYYKDVLPIVLNNCQQCHQEGGIGPVRLDNYADALENAQAIAEHVFDRTMPPWMPSPGCGSFRNERILTHDQIATIVGWYVDGAQPGDPADAPPPTVAPLGLQNPDLVRKLQTPYTPNDTLDDDYRCFVFDPELVAARDLTAFEVVPGDRREVHHVLLYLVDFAAAQDLDKVGAGYSCFGGPGLQESTVVGGWVPGAGVVEFPTGTGIRLEPGKGVVMQIHYNLGNGVFPDATEMRFRFSPTPVAKLAQIVSAKNTSFAIPPGAENYSVSVERAMPTDGVLWGMAPHMHTRGKRALIQRESGECLIDIPKWDFHWQDFYFTDSPTGIPLSKGDKLTFTCTWDNPTANTVRWGESTSDEMCIAYFYVSQP